ncbi:Uncharacterised protein [Vibrio cholerae]|nr:Uncharacterised protein [Vibrio cholerae]
MGSEIAGTALSLSCGSSSTALESGSVATSVGMFSMLGSTGSSLRWGEITLGSTTASAGTTSVAAVSLDFIQAFKANA